MIDYGFVDIFGIKWHNLHVDRYNKIQEEILKRKTSGFAISEQLLNDSHSIFMEPKRMSDHEMRRR